MKKSGFVLMILLATATGATAQEGETILDEQTVDLYNEAMACSDNGDYKGAVEKLLKALERTPDSRDIYASLVQACFNSNQTGLLKGHLTRAKAIFPGDDEMCYYLGTVHQKENHPALAIREFSLAIEFGKRKEAAGDVAPLLSAYYMYRGNCYLKLDQFEEAIADYTDYIALDDRSGAVYANRGIAYFKTGKPMPACADWRKARGLGITSVNQYLAKYCKR
ncbi:MAG: tetratricopeptide repeat protein [Odoribacteraceae bacterium]|jgi:tetratricopeptide (TPR) repeat protein|nr:tetratricopeptide repeat protein [Odoribacteraceae bacterium]